jgi:multiple sugar transport system permease protein
VTTELASSAYRSSETHRPHPKGDPRSGLNQQRRRLGLEMTLPAQLLLVFIVAFPTVMQVYVSLSWWSPLDGTSWLHAYETLNWFGNYIDLLTKRRFWDALGRTLAILVVAVPAEFLIGFALATLFADNFSGRRIFYSILLMPMMIVPAVVGYMFFIVFQSNGPLNQMVGIDTAWLSNPNLAMVAVIAADIWQWSPMMFLILLAGILGVPQDQLKAATLLGAGWWRKFGRIVLPRMKMVIAIAVAIRAVEAFKLFDVAFVMTQGGPGVATETISIWIYKLTFENLDWSFVAAVGITIMAGLTLAAIAGLSLMTVVRARQNGHVIN